MTYKLDKNPKPLNKVLVAVYKDGNLTTFGIDKYARCPDCGGAIRGYECDKCGCIFKDIKL